MASKLSGPSAAYRGIACLHQRPLRERAVSAQETRVHHISFSELTNTCWTAWSAGINPRSCDLLCESKTRPQALPPIRARRGEYMETEDEDADCWGYLCGPHRCPRLFLHCGRRAKSAPRFCSGEAEL